MNSPKKMTAFKHLLIPFLILLFGQVFCQQRFDMTVSLDNNIHSKNIKCYYDDGIDLTLVDDIFVNNTLNVTGDFYSKFVAFRIHLSEKMNSTGSQLAFDSIKNTESVFDTTTNKIWKEFRAYTEKEAQSMSELWEKHGGEIGRVDSITLFNKKLYKSLNDRSVQFLKDYPNDYFSFYLFKDQIMGPSIAWMSKDTSYMRSLLNSFTSIFPAVYTKSFEGENVIEKLVGLINAQQVNQASLPFSMKDSSGKVISLSDFNDRYILLDFWTSWCAPCRINNPILKNINDKYQNANFELISISADENSDYWKDAIQKDSMNWINLSDLNGMKSNVAIEYGINAYPTYILIDPSGKIFLRTVNEIQKLEEKINDIFTVKK